MCSGKARALVKAGNRLGGRADGLTGAAVADSMSLCWRVSVEGETAPLCTASGIAAAAAAAAAFALLTSAILGAGCGSSKGKGWINITMRLTEAFCLTPHITSDPAAELQSAHLWHVHCYSENSLRMVRTIRRSAPSEIISNITRSAFETQLLLT